MAKGSACRINRFFIYFFMHVAFPFLYEGRQRATEKMVDILVTGRAKYNRRRRKKKKNKKATLNATINVPTKLNKWKPLSYIENNRKVPLIIFGDGMLGKDLMKLKSNCCGGNREVVEGSEKAREREWSYCCQHW
ncbi:hypothetical protein RMCBS344292_17715 [Rhizopus microsporus]|nr:hypothetical protein RMCBS344292_17715 [Rhizopus microsporus]